MKNKFYTKKNEELDNLALKFYGMGNMKKGMKYEKLSDLLYKMNYKKNRPVKKV